MCSLDLPNTSWVGIEIMVQNAFLTLAGQPKYGHKCIHSRGQRLDIYVGIEGEIQSLSLIANFTLICIILVGLSK